MAKPFEEIREVEDASELAEEDIDKMLECAQCLVKCMKEKE